MASPSSRLRMAVRAFLLTFPVGSLCLLCSCRERGRIDKEVSIASPCVLVSQPSEHSGQKIRLTGYIASTKEGTYMWGDGCKNSGISPFRKRLGPRRQIAGGVDEARLVIVSYQGNASWAISV